MGAIEATVIVVTVRHPRALTTGPLAKSPFKVRLFDTRMTITNKGANLLDPLTGLIAQLSFLIEVRIAVKHGDARSH